MSVDLHCHSNISDGSLSPAQLVELAHQQGVRLFSITDHDNINGLSEAQRAAEQLPNFTFINGVEISTSWQGHSIHLVGLDFDPHNTALRQLLERNRQGRIKRLERFAERLAHYNIHGVYDGALALASNPEMVGRSHIARYMLEQGYISRIQQAFDRYIGEGKCASIPEQWASIEEAVTTVHQAGGLIVIAHPNRYQISQKKIRALCEEFKALSGDGIEVISGLLKHSELDRNIRLARDFNFYASVGSDFHHPSSYVQLGKIALLPPLCTPIWQQFKTQSA